MGRSEEQDSLPLFARFIKRTMGLHFPKERLIELEQKMSMLARRAGVADTEKYLLALMSQPLPRERMEELAAALTIGETYFLRDPRSYRLFAERVLPELVAARRKEGKKLRIWSAGCSTGEEPYSIAILLSRVIHDLADWEIELVGTDLNPRALERARRGVYGQWSFRNTPSWLMEYFEKREDGRHAVVPRIRRMVTFKELNLAVQMLDEAAFPANWDIIFCRNVMLYFDRAQIERTVAVFHAALADAGWLFVGPTELDHGKVPGFVCQHHEGAMVLRKGARVEAAEGRQQPLPVLRPAARPEPSTTTARSEPFASPLPAARLAEEARAELPAVSAGSKESGYQEALLLYQQGRYEQAARAALLLGDGQPDSEALALASRAYANVGRFGEARECCEKAIERDRLKAAYHYLLAIILDQQGETEAAMAALKRTLFVDHDYLLAYFTLGNLNRRGGDLKEAERNFNNALRLLENRHPHEVLEEAEGMTAGRLAESIRKQSFEFGV